MAKQRAISDIFQSLRESEKELRDVLKHSPRTSSILSLRMDGILSSIEEGEKTFHREGVSQLSMPSSTAETSSFLHTYWPTPPSLWILGLAFGLLFFGSTTVLSMVLNVSKLLALRTTKNEIGKLEVGEISELFGQSLLLTLVLVLFFFFSYTSTYWITWSFFFLFFFGPRNLVRAWLQEPEIQMLPDPEILVLNRKDNQANAAPNDDDSQRKKIIKKSEYPALKTLNDRATPKKSLRMDTNNRDLKTLKIHMNS